MRFFFLAIIILSLLGCKETTDNNPALPDLHNTNWNLHYKYNGFSFYAETELRFHSDTTFENIGVSDTVYGNWKVKDDSLVLYFDNAAVFRGVAISDDSLAGTMYNALTHGVWSAGRK